MLDQLPEVRITWMILKHPCFWTHRVSALMTSSVHASLCWILRVGTPTHAFARRFAVSQYSLKNMEEIPVDRQLL